uniref:GEN1 Holliday junction 5' flap endonuclease n=1 Tax=Leptobrachium leishanense TaxID=445787 RepID=A0A8C5R3H0_9ANUR
MGVHELWSILEPVKHHVPLHSLRGKTLAVDLSIWACEAQTIKKMVGVVTKPHLRNLFFRVLSLSLMGVKLIFVSEGEAPKIKAATMNKRNEMRFGPSANPVPSRPGRSYFKNVLKECLQLLECLGVPWVQAAGEAEAMCAYLDANGYVDGCITNDGDVFLYGAKTVYRNFTMNVKGVPGVGKEQALKLIETLKGESVLQRFHQWKKAFDDPKSLPISAKKVVHCSLCCHPGSTKDHERNGCSLCGSNRYCEPHDYDYRCPCNWHEAQREKRDNPVEHSIKMKAKKCQGFPFHEVIDEFLRNRNKLIKVLKWVRPNLFTFQNFALERMEWPKHYSCEKLLVLLTFYDMNDRKLGRTQVTQLQAIRIVKTRIRSGIPCFEIEWVKPDGYTVPEDHASDSPVVTIEEESLFQAAYPEIVTLYQKEKLEDETKKQKSKKTKTKSKTAPEPDDVALLLSEMRLKPIPNQPSSPESVEEPTEVKSDTKTVQKDRSPTWDLPIVEDGLVCPEALLDSEMESEVFTPGVFDREEGCVGECHSPAQSNPQPVPADSPNVSSLISELQLSDIDWDGTSFTKTPQVRSLNAEVICSDGGGHRPFDEKHYSSVEKRTMLTLNQGIRDQVVSTGVGSELASSLKEDEYHKLPLIERILLKNAYQSGVPCPQNHATVESTPARPAPLDLYKGISANSVPRNVVSRSTDESTKENRQIHQQNVASIKSSHEEEMKPGVLSIKQVQSSTEKPRPLEHPVTKSCNIAPGLKKSNTCTSVKITSAFVKETKKVVIAPLRTLSMDSISYKPVKQPATKPSLKKSVCLKVTSCSDDSEAEGSRGTSYETLKKTKTSRVSKVNSDHPNRQPTTLSKTNFITKNHTEVLLPNSNAVRSYSVDHLLSLPHKPSSMEIPDSQSDDDDSIVFLDSPLPLSERLKLRSLRN